MTFAAASVNPKARAVELDYYIRNIESVLRNDARARTPEADVLSAFTLAAESAGRTGNVVLIDSGLGTKGGNDFRRQIDFLENPSRSVSYLQKTHVRPDLRGRNVLFIGLGFVAPPQPQLDNRLRDNTRAIWSKIAQIAGAACVSVDEYPNTQDAVAGVPPVSIVRARRSG